MIDIEYLLYKYFCRNMKKTVNKPTLMTSRSEQ